jgi:hypothetical protein
MAYAILIGFVVLFVVVVGSSPYLDARFRAMAAGLAAAGIMWPRCRGRTWLRR